MDDVNGTASRYEESFKFLGAHHGAAAALGRINQFAGQAHAHGLLPALARRLERHPGDSADLAFAIAHGVHTLALTARL